MSAFNGATLMITGGTGSFGNTVLKHFLETDIGEIRTAYDDANLVLINNMNIAPLDGGAAISGSVTNLTDTEALIEVENMTVNGKKRIKNKAYDHGQVDIHKQEQSFFFPTDLFVNKPGDSPVKQPYQSKG